MDSATRVVNTIVKSERPSNNPLKRDFWRNLLPIRKAPKEVLNVESVGKLMREGSALLLQANKLNEKSGNSDATSLYNMAIVKFNSAIEKNPNFFIAHIKRAASYYGLAHASDETGDSASAETFCIKAIEDCKEAFRIDPNNKGTPAILSQISFRVYESNFKVPPQELLELDKAMKGKGVCTNIPEYIIEDGSVEIRNPRIL